MRFLQRTVRAIGLGLDALLVGAFLVGYVARYLPPRVAWWAELVATLLPYLTLGLVAATASLAWARRWRLVGVHGVLLVLAALRFVPLDGDLGGTTPAPDDLTVLTFNTSRGGGASADAQGQAITELIASVEPDLACFQELNLAYGRSAAGTPRTRLAPRVDSLGYRVVGPETPAEAGHAWQPVLARVPVTAHDQVIVRRQDGQPVSRVVRVEFEWQGRPAVLYNLHLQTFGRRKPWEDRERDPFSLAFWRAYLQQYRAAYLARAQEVAEIRKLLADETLPTLVCGDFNSTAHNWVFRQLADGLQDTFKMAGTGWGATYHARLPFARIDHVLASPVWEVIQADVGEAALSDHLPLVVHLRWQEGGGSGSPDGDSTEAAGAADRVSPP